MTFVLFFGAGLILSIIWLAAEARMRQPQTGASQLDQNVAAQLAEANARIARQEQEIASLRQARQQQDKAPSPPPPEVVPPPRPSDEEIATKISIWESVLDSHHRAFALAYNDLDAVLTSWTKFVGTAKDRQKLYNDLVNSTAALTRAGNEARDLKNSYPMYQDVVDALNLVDTDALGRASAKFSNALIGTPDDPPQNYETKFRPLAGALRREMDKFVSSLQKLQNTANEKSKELTSLK